MASTISRTIQILKYPAWLGATLALGFGVWSAVTDAAGPNRLVVPLLVDHTTKVEMFYDTGHGLRQDDSVSEIVAAGEELRELALPVPRVPLRAVRFDPMDSAGRFTIGQPRLETASGRLIAKFPMAALVPVNQIAEFSVDGRRAIGTTTVGATDPQIEFKLGAPLRVGTPRVPWIEAVVLLLAIYLPWRFKAAPEPASAQQQTQS